MTKKYKVLTNDLRSPFQGFQYEIGKVYECEDFDESDDECSNGFYATDVEGLIYSLNLQPDNIVVEVEMSGKHKHFDEYKQRWSKQKILRIVPEEENKKLIKEESDKMDWNYHEACYPTNPLKIKREIDGVIPEEIEHLEQWIKVGDSIGASIGDSIRDSIRYSVWSSVGDSIGDSIWVYVRASVRDSFWAYISSFFPNIKKWEGVEHEEGVNPFQCGIDLWNGGLIPSFDGTTWGLHAGEKAEIIYTMES